jgi:DNA-binding transcriptional LysR family regulator
MQDRRKAAAGRDVPARRRVKWDDLALFLALARARSLSGAASRLEVDASTASRRLAALERELGLRLFDRTPEGLAPTAYAERLFPEAEAMELAADRFVTGAEGFERAIEGRVRLSAPPGLVDAFVLPVLPDLARTHPALVVEVDARIGVADLTRREADLALRTLRPSGADLVQKRIFVTRSVIAGAPRYVRSLGRLKTLRDASFVAWGEDLGHLPHARWLRTHASGARLALVTSSMQTQLAAVQRGLGLFLVPRPFLEPYGLVEAPLSRALAASLAALPDDELWLVAHRALRSVPRVDALWRFLDAHFASGRERER